MPSFLTFERLANEPTRKTPIVRVLQKSSGAVLGTIRWYGAWRQFAFYPAVTTLFSAGCLDDINATIRDLMGDWRASLTTADPPAIDAEQLALARSLRGKFVRFHHESKVSPGYLVTAVSDDGMLEIQGWAGRFAPHLFERVDHPHSAAEGNC